MENQLEKAKVDFSYYTGKWVNSYDKARAIREFTLTEKDGKLQIHIEGSDTGFYPGDWGTAHTRHHAYAPDMNDIVALQARYDFDDFEAFLAINENKGLLIIAGYFTFKNDNERSDCFVREFFFKV